MKNQFFFIFLLVLLQSCMPEGESLGMLNPENLPSNYFVIHSDKDTTLIGENGVKLFIPKNAFLDENSEPVSGRIDIELKEAITLEDMVLGGLTTRADDGHILESSGMIYFDAEQNHRLLKLNPEVKIKAIFPDVGIRTDSKVFHKNKSNKWKEEGELANNDLVSKIQKGQDLFKDNCASCHSRNLRDDLTGPKLGNVHLFRELPWLIEYTRNSQGMIAAGDTLAVCVWNLWKPAAMNSFPNLTEGEISEIYLWIKNESKLQKIAEDEIEYITECDMTVRQNSITHYSHSSVIDSLQKVEGEVFITKMGWVNIDRFLKEEGCKAISFFAKLEVEPLSVNVYLVFPNRNIFISGFKTKSGNYCFSRSEQEKLTALPIGEEAIIVATGVNRVNALFGQKKIRIGENEIEEIELNPFSNEEILEKVKEVF